MLLLCFSCSKDKTIDPNNNTYTVEEKKQFIKKNWKSYYNTSGGDPFNPDWNFYLYLKTDALPQVVKVESITGALLPCANAVFINNEVTKLIFDCEIAAGFPLNSDAYNDFVISDIRPSLLRIYSVINPKYALYFKPY